MLMNDGKPLMLLHVIKLEHNILRGTPVPLPVVGCRTTYEGWNFNSGNYLFTTDTK